jgi:hypothetical protein
MKTKFKQLKLSKWPPAGRKKMEEQNFRLLSINVNGINKEKILNLTKIGDFDLLFLQETHNGLTGEIKVQFEMDMDCMIINNYYIERDTVCVCVGGRGGSNFY